MYLSEARFNFLKTSRTSSFKASLSSASGAVIYIPTLPTNFPVVSEVTQELSVIGNHISPTEEGVAAETSSTTPQTRYSCASILKRLPTTSSVANSFLATLTGRTTSLCFASISACVKGFPCRNRKVKIFQKPASV